MKNLTENIWLKLLAAFTAFIAAVRSFEFASQGLLVDGVTASITAISVVGAIAALSFSFTQNFRLVWLGFIFAALSLGDNLALYTAIAGIILAVLKDIEAHDKQARTKISELAPLILMVLGALFIVGPILASIALTPILCPSGANESNCAVAVLPWFTYLTAPLGMVLLAVAIFLKSRNSNKL